MRSWLNLELEQFHVHEAAGELASLVARILSAKSSWRIDTEGDPKGGSF